MDPAPDQPRSAALTDLAPTASSGAQPSDENEHGGHDSSIEGRSMSGGMLALGLTVGMVVVVVGTLTSSLVATALGLAVVVVALVRLFRRAGTPGRFALGALSGFLMLVTGLLLGIQSYDEKYFGNRASRELWDAVSLVGLVLMVSGILVAVGSLLGLLAVAIVRLLRRG